MANNEQEHQNKSIEIDYHNNELSSQLNIQSNDDLKGNHQIELAKNNETEFNDSECNVEMESNTNNDEMDLDGKPFQEYKREEICREYIYENNLKYVEITFRLWYKSKPVEIQTVAVFCGSINNDELLGNESKQSK